VFNWPSLNTYTFFWKRYIQDVELSKVGHSAINRREMLQLIAFIAW